MGKVVKNTEIIKKEKESAVGKLLKETSWLTIQKITSKNFMKEFFANKSKRTRYIIYTSGTYLGFLAQFLFQPVKFIDLTRMDVKLGALFGILNLGNYFFVTSMLEIMFPEMVKIKEKYKKIEADKSIPIGAEKQETPKLLQKNSIYRLEDYINRDYKNIKNMAVPVLMGISQETGKIILKDAAKFPHMLTMGWTGGGKSVLANGLLQVPMYTRGSKTLYILTDFKMLELNQYKDFDNCIYIEDLQVLKNVMAKIMLFSKERAKLFQTVGAKNIEDYNSLTGKEEPYIIFTIDECADLSLTPDEKLKKEINFMLMEMVNKFRALGILVWIFIQKAIGEQLNTSVRSQIPENNMFKVKNRDRQFMDFNDLDIEEIKRMEVGEYYNRGTDNKIDKIKSFLIQDNPMKPNFTNRVYEEIFQKNLEEEKKYYKMLPENAKKVSLEKKFRNNFDTNKTSKRVIEIKNFLLDLPDEKIKIEENKKEQKTIENEPKTPVNYLNFTNENEQKYKKFIQNIDEFIELTDIENIDEFELKKLENKNFELKNKVKTLIKNESQVEKLGINDYDWKKIRSKLEKENIIIPLKIGKRVKFVVVK